MINPQSLTLSEFNKMTQTNDNIVNRDELQEAYIESIIDGMDHKDLWQFVYDLSLIHI